MPSPTPPRIWLGPLLCSCPHNTEHALGPVSCRSHFWPLVPGTVLACCAARSTRR